MWQGQIYYQIFYQIFKKGGLAGSQFLEGGCRKRGGDYFQQGGSGCSFYIKNKLKSEILKNKIYKQKCLSAITKNLNWQIKYDLILVHTGT